MNWIKGYKDWSINENSEWSAQEMSNTLRSDNWKKHPSLTSEDLKKILDEYLSWDPAFQREDIAVLIALHPNLSVKEIKSLYTSPNRYIRQGIAENKSTPAEILSKLSEDEHIMVRNGVVRNPSAPTEILYKFISPEDSPWETRAAMALNPGAPLDIYKRLAQSNTYGYQKIIDNLAENQEVPTEALELINYSELTEHAKWYLSMHPNVPISLLIRLKSDDEKVVRKRANAKLEGLKRDPSLKN